MIDITTLKSIKNYAKMCDVSTSYIYKLIKDERMNAVEIDSVFFIDIKIYPSLKSKGNI